jgi:hypothetical protein
MDVKNVRVLKRECLKAVCIYLVSHNGLKTR